MKKIMSIIMVIFFMVGTACGRDDKNRISTLENSLYSTLSSVLDHYYSVSIFHAMQIVEDIAELDTSANQVQYEKISDQISIRRAYGNFNLYLVNAQQRYLGKSIVTSEVSDEIGRLSENIHEYFSIIENVMFSGNFKQTDYLISKNQELAELLKDVNVFVSSLGGSPGRQEDSFISDASSANSLLEELISHFE